MKLVIATSNAGKLREMQELLSPVIVREIVSLKAFPPFEMPQETGVTMQENARIKAIFCTRHLGLPCIADDSGLEVDALNGEPGVHSARWHPGTDEERSRALLTRLHETPLHQRTARFRCAMCLAYDSRDLLEVEATCEGRIALTPRGANGFGYDPIFEIAEASLAPSHLMGLTLAEISSTEKGSLSHRGRAIEILTKELKARNPRM